MTNVLLFRRTPEPSPRFQSLETWIKDWSKREREFEANRRAQEALEADLAKTLAGREKDIAIGLQALAEHQLEKTKGNKT
ncbi:MAG: hypothetical protein HQL38_16775 [Alphaproteobacteria bacterium]|nr:hypothetical protein [Alphaproteobacteria bacterium]MBF0394332.1 hypothetical protein [Alphaproteobacteria bacterium]